IRPRVLVVVSLPARVSVTPAETRNVPKLEELAPLSVKAWPTLLELLPRVIFVSTVIVSPFATTIVSPLTGATPPDQLPLDDRTPPPVPLDVLDAIIDS